MGPEHFFLSIEKIKRNQAVESAWFLNLLIISNYGESLRSITHLEFQYLNSESEIEYSVCNQFGFTSSIFFSILRRIFLGIDRCDKRLISIFESIKILKLVEQLIKDGILRLH